MTNVPDLTGITSAFVIRDADEFWNNLATTCTGNWWIEQGKDAILNAGFTKFICVFGVLIATRENYPD